MRPTLWLLLVLVLAAPSLASPRAIRMVAGHSHNLIQSKSATDALFLGLYLGAPVWLLSRRRRRKRKRDGNAHPEPWRLS